MGKTRDRVDACWSRADRTGVIMENRYIFDIGSIIAEINMGTATRFGMFFRDNEMDTAEASLPEEQVADREPIGDFGVIYEELCNLLEDIRQKWSEDDEEERLFNTCYQKDLLYLYDRITLDMDYLNGFPESTGEWLEKLLELKYEIRNLL